jgi:hypothetical protein
MPGLYFILAVGMHIPTDFRDYCFVNGNGNPIIVTNVAEPFEEWIKERLSSRRG